MLQRWRARAREALRVLVRGPRPLPVRPGPTYAELTRDVPVDHVARFEATDRLYRRLDAADVITVGQGLDDPLARAHWQATSELHRRTLAIVFGLSNEVPAVLAKTALPVAEPPATVHAMSRGPLAPGGAIYYANLISGALARVGVRMEDIGRGLDFGCSSGRVVGALPAIWPETEWHGCDPNADAIAWAQANLPAVGFSVSAQDPPLPYPPDQFDLVIAISIWSHYDRPAAARWLDEMRRVVTPGGRLLLTAHGPQSVAYYARERVRSPEQLADIRAALYRDGFWFANEFGESGDWGVVHPEWGTAFFTPEWLLRQATPTWVVEDYCVGQNAENQDVYVLRRAPATTLPAP